MEDHLRDSICQSSMSVSRFPAHVAIFIKNNEVCLENKTTGKREGEYIERTKNDRWTAKRREERTLFPRAPFPLFSSTRDICFEALEALSESQPVVLTVVGTKGSRH